MAARNALCVLIVLLACGTLPAGRDPTNPPVKAVQRFFHIEFDLTKVLGPQVVRAAGR